MGRDGILHQITRLFLCFGSDFMAGRLVRQVCLIHMEGKRIVIERERKERKIHKLLSCFLQPDIITGSYSLVDQW